MDDEQDNSQLGESSHPTSCHENKIATSRLSKPVSWLIGLFLLYLTFSVVFSIVHGSLYAAVSTAFNLWRKH